MTPVNIASEKSVRDRMKILDLDISFIFFPLILFCFYSNNLSFDVLPIMSSLDELLDPKERGKSEIHFLSNATTSICF